MKKEISPAFGIAAVVCVVLIAVYFLYHASVDKAAYPGLNAGHAGHMMTANQSDHKMTQADAARMHIPGVAPPAPANGPPQGVGTSSTKGQ